MCYSFSHIEGIKGERMPRIIGTTDYAKFKTLFSNRQINRQHFINLLESIASKNLLFLSPIIVNEKMEVIDGQHRLLAAENLGLEIFYIQSKGLDMGDVQLLNTNVKPWSMRDYVESYIAQGNKHYIYLTNFARQYGLSLTTASAVLTLSEESTSCQSPYKALKRGEFVVVDHNLARSFINFYAKASEYVEETTVRDRDYLRALYLVYSHEEIEQETFLQRLKTYGKPIFRRAGVREYLAQFEEVYNKGRIGNKLRLY
jgi:hypothetical protein